MSAALLVADPLPVLAWVPLPDWLAEAVGDAVSVSEEEVPGTVALWLSVVERDAEPEGVLDADTVVDIDEVVDEVAVPLAVDERLEVRERLGEVVSDGLLERLGEEDVEEVPLMLGEEVDDDVPPTLKVADCDGVPLELAELDAVGVLESLGVGVEDIVLE